MDKAGRYCECRLSHVTGDLIRKSPMLQGEQCGKVSRKRVGPELLGALFGLKSRALHQKGESKLLLCRTCIDL